MAKEKSKQSIDYEAITNQRVERAKERGAFVSVPSSAEGTTLALMVNSVDFVFRENRNPSKRLSLKAATNKMIATVQYKKALIAFSDEIKSISNLLGKDYKEQAIIKIARKEIEEDENYLKTFSDNSSGNDEGKAE